MFLSICNNGCGKTFPTDRGDCTHCGIGAAFCDTTPVDDKYWGYDLEAYPNIFTAYFIHINTGKEIVFEISDRKNQLDELVEFCYWLRQESAIGVGYNNVKFDYSLLHRVIENRMTDPGEIKKLSNAIIEDSNNGGYSYNIWDRDQIFKQLDLMKVHHFDNKAKATSLKQLEMWMGMKNVRDLPYDHRVALTDPQKDELISYNRHDVVATCMFFVRTLGMIELRDQMGEMFKKDFTNCSDVKMGELILIHEMEKRGIELYETRNGKKHKKQTYHNEIKLNDVIFDYIKFERPEFQELETLIRGRTITKVDEVLKTKGLLVGIHATVEGVEYKIGTGGIHASVDSCEVYSDNAGQIIDVDVKGFYPSVAKANNMYPAHLGPEFCPAYATIGEMRDNYPKKTHPLENGAYKLADNGAYGGSNTIYSPLYDPFYTMQTTINGQLMLCMLIEQMLKIPGLKMIQANTDGITYKCPHEYIDHTRDICKWWEELTKLELEEALYDSMHIRDVNNYIAVYQGGGVKRIGCYAHVTAEEKSGTRELPWNKDWSARVVQLAAEAAIVRREDIREFITNHKESKDFMVRGKVPRSSKLMAKYDEFDIEVQLPNVIRYYISKTGPYLEKVSPPTGEHGTWKFKPKPKGVTADKWEEMKRKPVESIGVAEYVPESQYTTPRGAVKKVPEYYRVGDIKTDINGVPHDLELHTKNGSYHMTRYEAVSKGWRTADCSDLDDFDFDDVDFEYYIKQCEKIVNPLLNGESI